MPKDLVILVADKNMEQGVRGLVARPRSLGIREIEFDAFVHPRRDPGCVREAHTFLQPLSNQYRYAIVMFDRQGSGREQSPVNILSAQVRQRLAVNGWGNRAEVIVLDPELEVWVFSQSPLVEHCLGWPSTHGSMRNWLENRGLWTRSHSKPAEPKRAMEELLQKVKRPSSAATYMALAKRVGLQHCIDPAFLKFRGVLASWFPVAE